MTDIARETGLSRASLYKALSPDDHPEFATVLKVMRALGLHLSVTPNGDSDIAAMPEKDEDLFS